MTWHNNDGRLRIKWATGLTQAGSFPDILGLGGSWESGGCAPSGV